MANNHVTKVMMAAANLDNQKIFNAIEARTQAPLRADTLEYGLDTGRIAEEAKHARAWLIARNLFISAASIVGAIIIFGSLQQIDNYYGETETDSTLIYIILTFLVIAIADLFFQLSVRARARDILYREHDEPYRLTELDQDQNAVIFGGWSPFLGSGVEIVGWSFAVNTKKPGDELKEVLDIDLSDLYAESVADIERMKLDGLTVKDEVFIDGRDVKSIAHMIPEILPAGEYGKPKLRVPQSTVESLVDKNDAKIRYYKVFRVSLWDGQIISSPR